MLRTQLLFIVLLVLSISCERTDGGSTAKGTVKNTAVDPHSYSNFAVINTEHLHLDLEINFENKTVYGVARHTMNNQKDADTATFDIKSLTIQKVTLGTNDNEVETSYEIGENHPLKGQPLHVMLKPGTKQVNIYYQTTEKTESIDWLPKEASIHVYTRSGYFDTFMDTGSGYTSK